MSNIRFDVYSKSYEDTSSEIIVVNKLKVQRIQIYRPLTYSENLNEIDRLLTNKIVQKSGSVSRVRRPNFSSPEPNYLLNFT